MGGDAGGGVFLCSLEGDLVNYEKSLENLIPA